MILAKVRKLDVMFMVQAISAVLHNTLEQDSLKRLKEL